MPKIRVVCRYCGELPKERYDSVYIQVIQAELKYASNLCKILLRVLVLLGFCAISLSITDSEQYSSKAAFELGPTGLIVLRVVLRKREANVSLRVAGDRRGSGVDFFRGFAYCRLRRCRFTRTFFIPPALVRILRVWDLTELPLRIGILLLQSKIAPRSVTQQQLVPLSIHAPRDYLQVFGRLLLERGWYSRDRPFQAVESTYQKLEPFRNLNRSLVDEFAGAG